MSEIDLIFKKMHKMLILLCVGLTFLTVLGILLAIQINKNEKDIRGLEAEVDSIKNADSWEDK